MGCNCVVFNLLVLFVVCFRAAWDDVNWIRGTLKMGCLEYWWGMKKKLTEESNTAATKGKKLNIARAFV